MFATLFNNVFPALGQFFGSLAGIAFAPFMTSLSFLLPRGYEHPVIDCVNVFTGVSFTLESSNHLWGIPVFGQIYSAGLETVRGICYYTSQALGVTDIPFIFALLVLFGAFFFGIVFFRWLISSLLNK